MTRPIWRDTNVLAPAAVLFGIMTAHTVLETARDALLLAKLGPQVLAWAYLAIAAAALVAVTAFRRWGKLRDPRRMLIGFLVVAACGTATISALIASTRSIVFVLYVWTGLVATLVVPSFWTMIDRSLRIAEAKRVFAVIGAGGTLGAMFGSALAAALGRVVATHHLVTVGAFAFGLATIAAITLAPRRLYEPRPTHSERSDRSESPEGSMIRRPRRYVRWMIALGLVSTVTVTLGDLTFKRVIAEQLDPGDLASVFGAIYTGLNVLSLVVQLALTPRLLARLGVGGALVVLPLILVTTAVGFAMTGTVIAIVALKLGDGGLRHSLHRVASEILYLPMSADIRDGAKPIADALGHRGGQALAALLVFAVAAAGAGSAVLALVSAAVGIVWLFVITIVRRLYMQQFRDTLKAGEIHRQVRVPELDATSVELLVESLSSPDEAEALAALDLLSRRGGRIPALVLYHPAQGVVRRALALLAGNVRPEVERVLAHLFEHADAQIRAGALAAASRLGFHHEHVVAALDDPNAEVRAAALVSVAADPDHAAVSRAGIATLLAGSTSDRIALARAIGSTRSDRFRVTLEELLARREPPVMRLVLGVLARAPEHADLDRLLLLLQDPHVRGDTRRVFLAAGEPGLDRLIAALDDPRTPLPVQRHLPRTISRFRSRKAAAALVERLAREPDGITEFKILRALGRMRSDNPRLPINNDIIRNYARRGIADAARYTTLRDRLDAEHVERPSPGSQLLGEILAEKRQYAIEHVFRALGILQPRAGLRSVHDAITSSDGDRRAAAREVLEHLVRSEIRIPLLALLDDLPHEVRRARLGPLAAGPFATYEAFVGALLSDPSASLRCIAAHHVGERHLIALRPDLARLRSIAGPPLVVHAFEQAIARLDG